MSQTLVDQITLDCLMNKETMGTLVVKQLEKQVEQEQFQACKERVVALFQQLANQEDPYGLTPDVKYAYYSFVKSAMGFFALADAPTDDSDSSIDEAEEDYETSNSYCGSSCDLEGDYDEEYASSSCEDVTRSVKMDLSTLDSFVTRTPRHKCWSSADSFAVKKSV